jgi:hypothetical protein
LTASSNCGVPTGAGSFRWVSPTARVDRRHEAALHGFSTPATQALPVGNVVLVERDPTHTALPGVVGGRDRLALFPSGSPSGNKRRTKSPDDMPALRDRQASPSREDFHGAGSRVTDCVLDGHIFRAWNVAGEHEGDCRSSSRWTQDNAGKWNAENTCTMLCDSVPGHFVFNHLQNLNLAEFGPFRSNNFGAPALPLTDFDLQTSAECPSAEPRSMVTYADGRLVFLRQQDTGRGPV